MEGKSGIFASGFRLLTRNKRYVGWFYLLNLVLSVFGAVAVRSALGKVLSTSLQSDKLVHGFDVFVFLELISKPEFAGHAVARPHIYFTLIFLLFSIFFMPGVLDAYASDRRLSREDFWATCGRNVWRFVRLFLINLLIAGIVFVVLSAVTGAVVKAADNSSNERLPFYVQMICAIIIFLIMTWVRLWFDLAQANTVIDDEPRVRKTLRSCFRAARRGGALFWSYVAISVIAAIIMVLGLWFWDVAVPSASVFAAFVVGQIILFLWLAARFWQRACAVEFCLTRVTHSTSGQQFAVQPVAPAIAGTPEPGPAT